MAKKLLITNIRMSNFAGSEIDSYSIATYFIEKGYSIDFFTIESKGAMKKTLEGLPVRILDLYETENLEKEYDFIWAHHFPLLDYVLFKEKVKAKKIIYASLSPYTDLECAPLYWKYLNLILCNSIETKKELIRYGIDEKHLSVFPNYAPKKYFSIESPMKKTLKKICVVSNHIPEEVREFKIFFDSKETQCDMFGIEDEHIFISEEILLKYDLIISIGKTINYGLALGIPVYCYDRFGGPGYLNSFNIQKAFEFNFSGRCTKNKKTSMNLKNDIIENYYNSLAFIESNKTFAYKCFCFEENLEQLLNRVLLSDETFQQSKCLSEFALLEKLSTVSLELVKIEKHFYGMLEQEYEKNKAVLFKKDNECYEYKRELDMILNSKAWKIAKHLRKVTRAFKQ